MRQFIDEVKATADGLAMDGPSSRFTIKLIKHLISGSSAKDKSVRYRIVQTLSILLNSLGEIDDDLYEPLRTTFVARANDKEPSIRVQAILGLAKLMGGEDDEDLEEDEPSLKEIVLDMMRFDPAAEVRRVALYHLPLQPETIDHILARSRDVDATLRKVLYSNILNNKNIPDMRVLTIGQREELIKNGLGDREPSVRNAAGGMISGWLGGEDAKDGVAESRAVDKLVAVSIQSTVLVAGSDCLSESILTVFRTIRSHESPDRGRCPALDFRIPTRTC